MLFMSLNSLGFKVFSHMSKEKLILRKNKTNKISYSWSCSFFLKHKGENLGGIRVTLFIQGSWVLFVGYQKTRNTLLYEKLSQINLFYDYYFLFLCSLYSLCFSFSNFLICTLRLLSFSHSFLINALRTISFP